MNVVNVCSFFVRNGGVALKELRHDITCNLQTIDKELRPRADREVVSSVRLGVASVVELGLGLIQ